MQQRLDSNVLKNIVIIVLVIFLAFSVILNVFSYVKTQAVIRQENEGLAFNQKFGAVQIVGYVYNVSPPVSMYKALQISLESDHWTATTLQNKTVHVNLFYGVFHHNQTVTGYELEPLNAPAPGTDFSSVKQGENIYRYVWEIVVTPTGNVIYIPPYGLYLVDVTSGEIIPHNPTA